MTTGYVPSVDCMFAPCRAGAIWRIFTGTTVNPTRDWRGRTSTVLADVTTSGNPAVALPLRGLDGAALPGSARPDVAELTPGD